MQLKLGLIGDNIKDSNSPFLHTLAGRLCGLEVSYDLLIPAQMQLDFESLLNYCINNGYHGLNITYPYKEKVVSFLQVDDINMRQIGACNTVVFHADHNTGYNTDYTGFVTAFRESFKGSAPGVVAMAGAGGVGKAIAFALAELGCTEIRIYDYDAAKAQSLLDLFKGHSAQKRLVLCNSVEEACKGADGYINCTPVGMTGKAGTVFNKELLAGGQWAFDAVYTPLETQFLGEAQLAGLECMSGYELFFYQGINAFRIFSGFDVDETSLRNELLNFNKNL
ncbi:shikimate dehydrogenase family protein [Brucellaceae bacterium C25G]